MAKLVLLALKLVLNLSLHHTNLASIKVVPASVAEVGEELPTTDVGEEEVEEGGVLPTLCQGDQEGMADCLNTGRDIREDDYTIMIMIKQDSLGNRLLIIIQDTRVSIQIKHPDHKKVV